MTFSLRILIITVIAGLAFWPLRTPYAQTFSVNNILDFGEVLDIGKQPGGPTNDRLLLNADGSYVYDIEFVVITPPTPADVSFTGGPPNTNFTLSANNAWIDGAMGGRFRINNYNFSPASGTTDGAGNGQFFIGARANTRRGGSTASYADDTHIGTFDVTVTFIP